MAASNAASTSLKEYLKKYESNAKEAEKKKKKKKKTKPVVNSVLVVDEDPIWQKPVKQEEESSDESAEEMPQVDEDIEVKRMKRLEQLRSRQSYHAFSEDGRGWVSISDAPKLLNSNNSNTDMSSPEPKVKHLGSESCREEVDLSPPRHQQKCQDSSSPETLLGSSEQFRVEPEFSPPRRRSRHFTLSDLEQSSECNRENTDLSPRQRRRHHSPSPGHGLKLSDCSRDGADLSLTQLHRGHVHSSLLEPEVQLSGSDKGGADLSPPRQQHRHCHTLSETTNILNRVDMNTDISPPRRSHPQRSASYLDLSPPRKIMKDYKKPNSLDVSPQQSYHRSTRASHFSSASNPSLPRENRKEESSLKELARTGLITGQDIKEENTKTRRDDWSRFKKMDPSISGQGAEAVYRDKLKGERISKEEFSKLHKKEEKPKEKKLEWGKGLAQKREAEEKQLELELEKDKPFARTRDDPDLDRMLKDRLRWGDPMYHLVKKKKSEQVLPDLGVGEAMKDSGFIVPQEIPSHSWIKRGLDAAPNRYGIKPGRHWDGVDRSTGFEKEMFKRMNEKRALEREAYLWSVSDM